MRRAVLAALLILWGAAAESAPATLRGLAQVADGDSLRIGGHAVRLWGVDAPEARQICRRNGKRWACGQQATAALRERIGNRPVHCRVKDVDRHRRLVARCTVSGQDLGTWLVREGWALDVPRYSGGAHADAEAQARDRRANLWSGTFETPERYRQRQRQR